MKKNTLTNYIFSISVLLLFSCNTNNNDTNKEDLEKRESTITKNQEKAKLLVLATENYFKLIDYSNYIKSKETISNNTKVFLNSFNTGVITHLNTIKKISEQEMVSIPDQVNISTSYEDKAAKEEHKLLKDLYSMIDEQIRLMDSLNDNYANSSLNYIVVDAEDFLKQNEQEIQNLINNTN